MQITKGDEDVLALNTNFTMSFTDDLDSWMQGYCSGMNGVLWKIYP